MKRLFDSFLIGLIFFLPMVFLTGLGIWLINFIKGGWWYVFIGVIFVIFVIIIDRTILSDKIILSEKNGDLEEKK